MFGFTRCRYPSLLVLILILVVVFLITVTLTYDFALQVEGRETPPVTTPQVVEPQVKGAEIESNLQVVEPQVKTEGPALSLPEKVAEPAKELLPQKSFRPPKFEYVSKPVTPIVDDKIMRGL